jgi:hypothetical protein
MEDLMLPSDRPPILIGMTTNNRDQFGSDSHDYVTRPEPSDALQQGRMRQLSPANFDLTLPSVQWSNWISGYTANKKRKLVKQQEEHIREINTPIFGVFGGDRGPSGMNEATKQVFQKRLTGAHESNKPTSYLNWKW